jgi:hypothetical protein
MFPVRAPLLSIAVVSCLAGLVIAPSWVPRAQAQETETATAAVVITSVPDHGEVFLGMERIGVCPLSKRLPLGTFPLMVRQGDKVWQGTVDVKQGKTAKVVARLAEPNKHPAAKDVKTLFAWAPSWLGYASVRSMEQNPRKLQRDSSRRLVWRKRGDRRVRMPWLSLVPWHSLLSLSNPT